jgi:hypothetical protein
MRMLLWVGKGLLVCYSTGHPSSLSPWVHWGGSGHAQIRPESNDLFLLFPLQRPFLSEPHSIRFFLPSFLPPSLPPLANLPPTAPTRKQRIKATRKQSKLSKDMPPSIPIHEQSRDLTVEGDDAVVSLERRSEIIRSSRVVRRKGIREDNFLRGL